MKPLLLIISIALVSCTQKPIFETHTVCDDEAAVKWIEECIKDAHIDTLYRTQLEAYQIYCTKQAHDIFCRKVTMQTNAKYKNKK